MKIKNKKGISVAIFVEIILIIILSCLLLTPVILHLHEAFLLDAEKRHEQTAYDSLIMEHFAYGDDFEAIYDAVNKRFVKTGHIREVTPYGRSKKHKGRVLYIKVNKEGEISEQWVLPDYFDKRDLDTES